MWLYRTLCIITLLTISSCGFRPIYEKNPQKIYMQEELAKIKIEVDDSEVIAKELKFSLERYLNPKAKHLKKEYLLKIKLKKEIFSSAIQKNSEVTRYSIKFVVDFELGYLTPYKIIDKGVIKITSSYDTMASEYADYTAEGYSSQNNIREICEELQTRLSMILRNLENENK